MMKRLWLLAVVLVPLFFGSAVFGGAASGFMGIAEAATSLSCSTETSPGCTNGLPTDEYSALLAQMQAHPTPEVSPITYDQKEVWSYSFWKVTAKTPMYDAPGGNVIATLDGFTFVSVYGQKGEYTQ